jgi:putative transcriptional regulator
VREGLVAGCTGFLMFLSRFYITAKLVKQNWLFLLGLRGLMETLGEKLKKYRDTNKITQRRMADVLGVTITTVQNWESGRYIPRLTPNQTKTLCDLLNITLDDLVDEPE